MRPSPREMVVVAISVATTLVIVWLFHPSAPTMPEATQTLDACLSAAETGPEPTLAGLKRCFARLHAGEFTE